MHDLVSRFLRFILKLVFAAVGVVLALALIAVALLVVTVHLLRALVTGKKPAPSVVFGRFQRFSPGGLWPAGSAQPARRAADVVDVEVREIPDDKPLAPASADPKAHF